MLTSAAPKVKVVVPYHRDDVIQEFLSKWGVGLSDSRFVFIHDKEKKGCAVSKNEGIAAAVQSGAEVIIVLDSDCFPAYGATIEEFIEGHLVALQPVKVKLFKTVTHPQSRGTPEIGENHLIEMPVAASMGFWHGVGDYSAARQISYGSHLPAMEFDRGIVYGQPFALSGMNVAFRSEWADTFKFIDIPRYDDIWAGWIFQKIAYKQLNCFNLNGPDVLHSRQSDFWQNLKEEAQYGGLNEKLWEAIWRHRSFNADKLRDFVVDRAKSCK